MTTGKAFPEAASRCAQLLSLSFILGSTSLLQAQHYPVGSEGMQGATLPSCGLYTEDDNSIYWYHEVPGFAGQLENGHTQFTYTQTPRLLCVAPWKLWDTEFGAGLRIPFTYQEYTQNVPVVPGTGMFPAPPGPTRAVTARHFGLSDLQVEPVILAWQLPHFDFIGGYSFWIPTGDWNDENPLLYNLGQGYWTHSVEFGATWYIDDAKSWALSLLNHYDINTCQYNTLVNVAISPANPLGTAYEPTTLGNIYTLEWAVSKTIRNGVDLGLSGYYQQQVTDTEGPTPNGPTWPGERIHVAGLGPEIRGVYARWGLSGSLRYDYESSAKDHPQGQRITLTIAKSF
jgi:hypothetical protein